MTQAFHHSGIPLTRLICFFCFFLFLQHLNAQEPWTLEKCIRYAQENNLQVKIQQLNVDNNNANLTQAYGSVLPNLSATTGLGFLNGHSVNPYTYQYTKSNQTTATFTVGGTVGLFNGLQKYYTIEQNRLSIQAALQDVEKAKNDISINVATSYLQILYYNELVKVDQYQADLTRTQVARVQILVSAGSVPEGDLYDIKSQLSQDELQLIDDQNNLSIAKLTLSQLLELKDANNFYIVEPGINIPLDTIMLETVNSIYNEALTFLPEFKSFDLKIHSSEYSVKAAKSSYYPSLSGYYNYSTGYSSEDYLYNMTTYTEQLIPFRNQLSDNAYLNYGFSLVIPIFSNYKIKTAVTLARISTSQTEINMELAKKDVYKSIQQDYANAINAKKKFIASIDAVTNYKEAFRYAQQKYENGAFNALEYNTAKTKLAKGEADLLQAKYDYLFRRKILDFYSGKPLSL